MKNPKRFVYCEKCGKRLIERLPNGMFRFMFGRDKESGRVPVDLIIYGSVKIKCIKASCDHYNIVHFFPPQFRELAENSLQSYDTNLQSEFDSEDTP